MSKRILLALTLFSFAACGKKSDDKKPSASPTAAATPSKPGDTAKPAADKPKSKPAGDMSKLAFGDAAKDWEPNYNTALEEWQLEKYTPAANPDDGNQPNRFDVSKPPDDAPLGMDDYAAKLQEKDFQDIGFKYSQIASKTALPNGGWLIKGTVVSTDPNDKDAKPEVGFVALVDVGGAKIRCKSETMTSDKLVDEAVELCKGMHF